MENKKDYVFNSNYKKFADNWDLSKPLKAEDLQDFDLNELKWIKDIFWKRINAEIAHELEFVSDLDDDFEGSHSSKNYGDTICYKSVTVYSAHLSLAVPGEWIGALKNLAEKAQIERNKQAEAKALLRRYEVIAQLLGIPLGVPSDKFTVH